MEPVRRRSRAMLVGVFLVAFVPLIGAYALYVYERGMRPWATTNQGELLLPLRSADALRVVDPNGRTAPLAGRWWILVVAERTCDGECAAAAKRLRAVHVLLNQDRERVRRGILLRDAVEGVGIVDPADPALERVTGTLEGLAYGIYVIDPLTNLVLHYPFSAAGKPVLQDLKRLLSVSQIG
jgi:hypothetical protein